MKKIIFSILMFILMVTATACGEEFSKNGKDSELPEATVIPNEDIVSDNSSIADDITDVTLETTDSKVTTENITASSESNNSEAEEDRYLTYVLGKCIRSDGREVVYLTDERDYDNWRVPIYGVASGEPDSTAKLRFIGIDWNADNTIKQVFFADFTVANTYGSLENSGTNGTLNVTSYGADVSTPPQISKWNIAVNGEEVVLTDEDNDAYYFYEDHFDE